MTAEETEAAQYERLGRALMAAAALGNLLLATRRSGQATIEIEREARFGRMTVRVEGPDGTGTLRDMGAGTGRGELLHLLEEAARRQFD